MLKVARLSLALAALMSLSVSMQPVSATNSTIKDWTVTNYRCRLKTICNVDFCGTVRICCDDDGFCTVTQV